MKFLYVYHIRFLSCEGRLLKVDREHGREEAKGSCSNVWCKVQFLVFHHRKGRKKGEILRKVDRGAIGGGRQRIGMWCIV